MVFGSGRNHTSALINNQSARPACADIDPEEVNNLSVVYTAQK